MSIPTPFNPLGTLGEGTTAPDVLTGPVYIGQLDGLSSSDTERIKTVSIFEEIEHPPANFKRLFQLYQKENSGRFFCVSYDTGWNLENNAKDGTGKSQWMIIAARGGNTLEMSGSQIVLNGSMIASTTGVASKNIPLAICIGGVSPSSGTTGFEYIRWHSFEFYVDDVLAHRFEPLRRGDTVGMKDITTGRVYFP